RKVQEETRKIAIANPVQAIEVTAELAISLEAHADAIATLKQQNQETIDGKLDDLLAQTAEVTSGIAVTKAEATEKLVVDARASVTVGGIAAKKERVMKNYQEAMAKLQAAAEASADAAADTESETVSGDDAANQVSLMLAVPSAATDQDTTMKKETTTAEPESKSTAFAAQV